MRPTRSGLRCAPWLSLLAGGFIPRVSWQEPDRTFHMFDGPEAFSPFRETEEASPFLARSAVVEIGVELVEAARMRLEDRAG